MEQSFFKICGWKHVNPSFLPIKEFILCGIVVALLFGCVSKKISPHPSPLASSPKTVHTYGVLEGLVQIYDHHVYIITNYKSRSRVDYRVTGELKDKIAALDGQLVTVEGTAIRRGWSGTLEVVRILKPKRLPSPPGKKALPSDTKN